MIIIYGLSSKWHCWSNSCWLAVFLFLSMSSAGLVVTERLLERKKTDARWQRKQRVRSGGRQTTMIEGAGRNVRGVASVERWREEARGRWEMPDGGTETQHEWTQAAEGWMWGRGKYEHVMRWQVKGKGKGGHFIFSSHPLFSYSVSAVIRLITPFLEMSLARSWFRLSGVSASSWCWL